MQLGRRRGDERRPRSLDEAGELRPDATGDAPCGEAAIRRASYGALPCFGVVDAAVGDGGEDLADGATDGVQVAQRQVALVQLTVEVDPVDDPDDGLVHLQRS